MGCTRRKVAALTLLATALDRIPAQVSLPVEARLKQLCDAASKGALRLQASAERGRHMVAARDIKAGEAVLTSDCYATVVAADKVSALCGRCMGTGGGRAPMRCATCGTRFCDQRCLDDAGAEHVAECGALAAIGKLQGRLSCDSDSARLALRALARCALEAGPEDGEVHWVDVHALLSHRAAAERSALWKQRLADAELLLQLLPPPVRGQVRRPAYLAPPLAPCTRTGPRSRRRLHLHPAPPPRQAGADRAGGAQLSNSTAAELLLRIRYNSFPIADAAVPPAPRTRLSRPRTARATRPPPPRPRAAFTRAARGACRRVRGRSVSGSTPRRR